MKTTGISLAELAAAISAHRGDALAVTGPGAMAGALSAAGDRAGTIYNMELGYASATALGIAMQVPQRRVIALEGDGSLFAGLGVLGTIARYRPANLVCIAVVNGVYGTGDHTVQTQSAFGADFGAVARALGWPGKKVIPVIDRAALDAALQRGASAPGPWLVTVPVDVSTYGLPGARPRPAADVVDCAILFRRHIEGKDR
jgi:thiamine pyrophosphate-dependent acetolactate synthase large subunit-like protein